MKTRLAITGFAALVTVAVAVVAAQNPPAGQQPPTQGRGRGGAPTPTSCGPNPPAEMKNVARDSRCFELRTYTFNPAGGNGSVDLMHERFRKATLAIFKKHDMTVIGLWQPIGKPDTLVYILAFKDAAARDAAWAAFQADPDWVKARTEMNVSQAVINEFMIATDYSPLK